MQRDDVLHLLAAKRVDWTALSVKSIALFGSVARNEGRPDSDLDFLVEFEGPATYDKYLRLKETLENWLDRRIDLVTRRAVKPRLRAYIEAEAVYVA
jgi:predicted nucleotidyltransferase